MANQPILVIDDDLRMRQLLRDTLAAAGFTSDLCADGREAAAKLAENRYDIVITDLKMPFLDGIEILKIALQLNAECMVILVTGYATIESAVEAIKKGAYDYVQKPFEPDEMLLTVERAAEHIQLLKENRVLRRQVNGCQNDELIGVSPQIKQLKELVAQVAPFATTVLIQGETGTGKELVAKMIHKQSKRSRRIFLPINCGALPENLLESELFGHVRGAYTGADQDKQGLFEAADQGTIFLDEIDSTTTNFQIKLLRVLQEGSFLKVGGRRPCQVDVRVIAASSRSLSQEVAAGRFRSDLFFRLNVVNLELPPLRLRPKDIPALAHHFVLKYSAKYSKKADSIPGAVINLLQGYSWPGNVRELENAIERAVILCPGIELQPEHLPPLSSGNRPVQQSEGVMTTIAEMEKIMIAQALQSTAGHRGLTANILGISPVSLWRKIKKYELNPTNPLS